MGSITNRLSAMDSLLICFCVLFVMACIIMGYLMIKDPGDTSQMALMTLIQAHCLE